MTELTRDNLFQLNVIVWATFPQPDDAPVTPVLRRLGYTLHSIERPLDPSVTDLAALRTSEPSIQPAPVTDAVLEHRDDDKYVLVECKPGSFGSESGRAAQARGLIVAGAHVRARLGLATGSAEVCLIVPSEDCDSMDGSAVQIREEVAEQRYSTCDVGALGIKLEADGVYLCAPAEEGQIDLARRIAPQQKVIAVTPGQDPRPLYVVPWIPGASDDADQAAFREKLRSQLLSYIGRHTAGSDLALDYNTILDDVSHGVFRLWRDKGSLQGQVHPMVARLLQLLFQSDARATIKDNHVVVRLDTEESRTELMEKVRTAALPERTPEGVQPSLFEEQQ